ncbi:hypothetical protein [Cellulomonas xiejunii]|uniref:Lipoprotein n=1 Tax=Cellulomonas xiejunii TaxID=2968083 RepID=A0ABY5KR16_9CELL|nr:hypothetical protein [Cellulomonas xiejunii]UUI71530.1 hypothetical protein NP048_17335 [Cellulomonas xiejunii]
MHEPHELGRVVPEVTRPVVLMMAAVVTVSLASCAAEEPPAVAPDLVWNGAEPDGPLESDPWVSTIRAGHLAFGLAANAADFSDPDLTRTWRPTEVDQFVTRAQGELLRGNAKVYLGPLPFAPLAVEVEEGGTSARVAACIDDYDTLPREPADGSRWPTPLIYFVELTGDGQRRIVGAERPPEQFVLPDGAELTPDYCDGVPIPRATFDPPPDLETLSKKGRDDVVPPAPSDPSVAP